MQNIGTSVEHNLTTTEYWIKFVADTTFVNINLYKSSNSPSSQLTSIELFSGNCNSLNLLSSMNLYDSTMTVANLINGNTYYVKLTQSQAVSSYSGIMLFAPINNVPMSCPTACNLVPNGCFDEANINVDLMSFFNNGSNSSVYWNPLFSNGQYNNSLSNVCGWYDYFGSPQLKKEVIPTGFNYFMFLMDYNHSGVCEEIVSELNNGNNLNADSYILRYKHKDINGHTNKIKLYLSNSPLYNSNYQNSAILLDDKNVTTITWKQEEKVITISANQTSYKYLIVHPQSDGIAASMLGVDEIHLLSYQLTPNANTICDGDNTTLTADLCDDVCPEDNFSVTYSWTSTPADPSLVGQETQAYITVSPSVTTTYTATATTNMGNSLTKSVIVTVNPTPNIPEFIGDIHICNGTSTYIINNFDPNAIYNCTVLDANGNPLGNPAVNGNSFTINWNNYGFSPHWTIQLEASYTSGCSSLATLDIFTCCMNGTFYIDQILTGNISGQIVSFNGTITVPAGQSLTIDNSSHVFMGGNAKIVLETGATFEIINSSIEACGNNLWDGIYTEDVSTTIYATNSQIFDAKNAIVSNNGGNYSIDQTTFDRNYVAIQVNDFLGDHSGEVFNSIFIGSSSLLYPYQNSQSLAAFELNNVIKKNKLIRIGSINGRNTIRDFKNGVLSDNSDFVAFALDISDCVDGVSITGNDNDLDNRRAIIGSSNPFYNCTFNDLIYGVFADQKSDIYI